MQVISKKSSIKLGKSSCFQNRDLSVLKKNLNIFKNTFECFFYESIRNFARYVLKQGWRNVDLRVVYNFKKCKEKYLQFKARDLKHVTRQPRFEQN